MLKNFMKDVHDFDLILASQTLEGVLSYENKVMFEKVAPV